MKESINREREDIDREADMKCSGQKRLVIIEIVNKKDYKQDKRISTEV